MTLNWRAFNASWRFSVPQNQSDAGAADIERPKEWWVFTLQLIVLCFPIIDQVSVYPIVGNAMANNMTAYIVPWSVEGADSADGVTHTARQRTLAKYGIRLLCAVPPIFLGAIAGNLKTIFAFAVRILRCSNAEALRAQSLADTCAGPGLVLPGVCVPRAFPALLGAEIQGPRGRPPPRSLAGRRTDPLLERIFRASVAGLDSGVWQPRRHVCDAATLFAADLQVAVVGVLSRNAATDWWPCFAVCGWPCDPACCPWPTSASTAWATEPTAGRRAAPTEPLSPAARRGAAGAAAPPDAALAPRRALLGTHPPGGLGAPGPALSV